MVDSTVWSGHCNGIENPQIDYLHRVMDTMPSLIDDLILAEVLQRHPSDAGFERVRRALEKHMQVAMVDPELALQSARSYRLLRSIWARPCDRTACPYR